MKILVLNGRQPPHLYGVSSAHLVQTLRELGADVRAISPDGSLATLAQVLLVWRPQAVISFSAFYSGVQDGAGRSLYDLARTLYVGWHFDHPVYTSHLLASGPARRLSIFPNVEHLQFLDAAGWTHPGTVMLPGAAAGEGGPKPLSQRKFGVVLAATWNGAPDPLWRNLPPSAGRSLLQQTAERLLERADGSVLEAFSNARADLGLEGLQVDAAIVDLIRFALTYVRHHDRLKVVEALVGAGLPLTLVGQGWDSHFGARPGVVYLPEAPFPAMGALYAEAQVVVNFNAANGGSERALGGALAGAAVVSDAGDALERILSPGLRVFDRARPEDVAVQAGDLLESPAGAELAQAGYEAALERGLWTHRAAELLQRLRSVGLGQPG